MKSALSRLLVAACAAIFQIRLQQNKKTQNPDSIVRVLCFFILLKPNLKYSGASSDQQSRQCGLHADTSNPAPLRMMLRYSGIGALDASQAGRRRSPLSAPC